MTQTLFDKQLVAITHPTPEVPAVEMTIWKFILPSAPLAWYNGQRFVFEAPDQSKVIDVDWDLIHQACVWVEFPTRNLDRPTRRITLVVCKTGQPRRICRTEPIGINHEVHELVGRINDHLSGSIMWLYQVYNPTTIEEVENATASE